MAMASPPVEDMARLLEDALLVVRNQAQLMRRCLETPGKLMDALKCSSTLVSELRTSSLGPKQYYELYMSVFDALRHLSVYLRDSHPVNHLADLYELVQYAGNIVPRLYLMITVGTVYMSIDDAPVKEIMKDMMEMSRGVQHPIRGLFLRYYLSGQARDALPTGDGEGPEGNLQDSISFILTNFVEMNKLWVRLQHQGHSREREQRTKERQELQLLVGSNLVRLSQLVDLESYKSTILQPLLEQVVQCRDVLAQEYLLEVITQVFPDEFHLHTLHQFLSATARLNPHVDVKAIVIGLMDRLAGYAQREAEAQDAGERERLEAEAVEKLMKKLKLSKENGNNANGADASNHDTTAASPITPLEPSNSASKDDAPPPANTSSPSSASNKAIPQNIALFEIFYEQVVHLISLHRLPLADVTALLVSLVNLALSVYPERLDYVDQVLGFASKEIERSHQSGPGAQQQREQQPGGKSAQSPQSSAPSASLQENVLALLLGPVKAYCSLFTALALPNFAPLFRLQSPATRRSVAGEVARSLLRNETRIASPEHLDGVLQILSVLIKPESASSAAGAGAAAPSRRNGQPDSDEAVEEQGWLARMVHLVRAPRHENGRQFALLQQARAALAEGGERTKFTTPALLTQSLKLARRFKRREHLSSEDFGQQSAALWKFCHGLVSALYTRYGGSQGVPELCLRLFVSCGQVAVQCGAEDVGYEFFAQAFGVYEEGISDSRGQFQGVCILAGALRGCGGGAGGGGGGVGGVGGGGQGFGRENYDTLITKCALHGSKLLKKPDQCRAVYLASHLWWAVERGEEQVVVQQQRGEGEAGEGEGEKEGEVGGGKEAYRDGKRVLECLQRALRVADACMDTAVSVELFVEILNRYVYYFDQANEAVTTKYLNGLIELIHSNLSSGAAGDAKEAAGLEGPRRHFERTLAYIRGRGYEGVVTGAKG
ncbi:hypothetical protein LTR08_008465 [Meristemomyces frigidus]|nr:hypothetical protein LTR08_008465 [Meristemomyces frigidus]